MTEMFEKNLLGKIFISHSSADKPFVRRLAHAIEKAGFQTWLDEKELLPGDPLPKRLGEALNQSRVVLVVVSKSSVKSKWLAFELNKATDRMVKGECRVIPVVKEKEPLPAEVVGLLYADFTGPFQSGLKSIITALKHDARQAALEHSFWARTKLLLEQVFDGSGFVSGGGEYKRLDYDILMLNRPEGQEEPTIVYEIVSAYQVPAKSLSERWWTEYLEAAESTSEKLFLIVSERPIGFAVEHPAGVDIRVGFKTLGWKDHVTGYVVTVDLSKSTDHERQKTLLEQAKAHLDMLDAKLRRRKHS